MKQINYLILIGCIVWMTFWGGGVYAQNNAALLTGKVTEKGTKQPIVGATVVLKDNDNRTIVGTTTDVEGNYSLRARMQGLKLAVSYTGYKSSGAIAVGDRKTINVQIESTNRHGDFERT